MRGRDYIIGGRDPLMRRALGRARYHVKWVKVASGGASKISTGASTSWYQSRLRSVAFSTRRWCRSGVYITWFQESGRHAEKSRSTPVRDLGPDAEAHAMRVVAVVMGGGQALHRHLQWFRDGLVFEAHRLVYHSA